MKKRGYHVLYGAGIGVKDHQFAGSDELRARDLQQAMEDSHIRAIFFARGGYGAARLLDRIRWESLQQNPKWLCGYSDATALLNHAHAATGVVTLHGPMPFQFRPNLNMDGPHPDPEGTNQDWEHTLRIMEGELMLRSTDHLREVFYPFEPQVLSNQRPDSLWPLQGKLIGGNLSVLYSLLGSGSLPDSRNCLLIAEDIDEYLYHLDRMWLALQRSGYLNPLRGILLGDFTDMRDNVVPYGQDPLNIAAERLKNLGIPCITGLPFGHGPRNNPLPLGWTVHIGANGLSLYP
jgi:muramoyltetrapeptide carboxypeptidase